MDSETFNKHIERQIDRSKNTLLKKAREYASTMDRLHNFRVAAQLQNFSTAEALTGMMSKHIVSVYDMVCSGKKYREEEWDEKIGDAINYLLILRAVVSEENTIGVEKPSVQAPLAG